MRFRTCITHELPHGQKSMVPGDIFINLITNLAYVRGNFGMNRWDAAVCLALKALKYIIIV